MRLKAEDKARIRKDIVAGAASVLRARGYDDVNLDDIMKTAGLTRGAFYAHFKSKTELLTEVVRNEHPLCRMLNARTATDAAGLRQEMMTIFANYLAPAHHAEVFRGCTVAALTGDTTRAPEAVKAAYEAAWNDIVAEMGRGQTIAYPDALRSALILATGAVSTAQASATPEQRADILSAAWHCFSQLIGVALK